MLDERERLAERLPVDDERQVDRELHARARAHRPDMLDAPAELLEDRPRARHIGRFAADEAEELALARRPTGAPDRAFDEGAAGAAHLLRERLRYLGPHGAHLDEEPPAHRGQHLRVHRVHRRRVGEHADHHLACRRELGRGVRHLETRGARLVRRAVPDHHLVPEAREPPGDARAHLSDSGDADFHVLNTSLVSIATDTLPLEGAWYEPAGRKARGAALLSHGNTMNFYSGAPRFLPPRLAELGLASLAFNRRGHDILAIRDSRVAEGAAFQTIAEAIADNRYAAEWLAARGFAHPVVIGHSNGGMLAVRHVADHPQTPALVLLSAHCGGARMVPLASAAGLLAGDKLLQLTAQAQEMVKAGRGGELMLMPGWWYVTSAASFLDLANCPDILELAPKIRCPVLYLRGDREPRDLYPAEEFQRRCSGPCTVEIVPQCDHFYAGRESAVSAIVYRWLGQTLQGGQQ